ncbi:MAG: NAD-dependent epimerase/dehydratase family protein [Planctomycetota bacterium]
MLLTGATGFVGRETARELVAAGAEVHAFVRAGSERASLANHVRTWHVGDLSDARSIDAAVLALRHRANALSLPARIVHSAALISYRTRDGELARELNVEGTRRFLAAALRNRIDRFLFVSSVVTVGHSPDGSVLDESAPFHSAELGVDYVTTKRAAEDLVLAHARELDVVVVNPGAIFGPVDRESNTVRFLQQMARGRGPRLAPPGHLSVVGVADVARGIVAALAVGRRGERYLLVESSSSALELFQRIARELSVPPVRHSVPRAIWSALVMAATAWDRVFPMKLATPQALKMLGVKLRFDARKARRELAFEPEPFDRVLRDTIAHLRATDAL